MEKTPDLRTKEDKLNPYLAGAAQNYLFDELSPSYLTRNGLDFLKGVSVPLKAEDMVEAQNGGGLDVSRLADNMAVVIGANTHFPFAGQYIRFFAACFNEKLVDVFTSKGSENLNLERFRMAAVYFRAALLLDGADLKAVYGYACCCRQWYLSLEGGDEEELIAILKQDATNYFEWCTMLFPDFAPAYYFLGYAYLNLALYTKASLTWKRYLKLCNAPCAAPQSAESACRGTGESQIDDAAAYEDHMEDDAAEEGPTDGAAAGEGPIDGAAAEDEPDEISEIRQRLESLEEPVKIEGGINSLLAGRYEEGLKVLEPYVKTEYNDWWPLHFYLGGAYRELGYLEEAAEGYLNVLRLSPSNIESICALAEIYAELGDNEKADKYYNKAKLLKNQAMEEQA